MATQTMSMSPAFFKKLGSCYKNTEEALEEFIDNCYDAGPSEIHFRTELLEDSKKAGTYIVTDNGCGMSEIELRNAFDMGNNVLARVGGSIGAFHVGMKSAMFKVGLCLQVYTVDHSGNGTYAIVDYDHMVKTNSCAIRYRSFNPVDRKFFNQYVPSGSKHGTVFVFTELINARAQAAYERKRFSNRFGTTYRHRLADPSQPKMYFKSKKKSTPITAIDSIGWDLYPKCRKTTGKVPVTFRYSNVDYDWHWRCVFVSADDAKLYYDSTTGNPDPRAGNRSGVYYIREDREMLPADWDQLYGKMYTRYSHLNGLFFEVFVSNKLDRFLGLKMTKNGINFADDPAREKFRQHVMDTLLDQIKDAKKINSKDKNIGPPPPPSIDVQKENEHFANTVLPAVETKLNGLPPKPPGVGKGAAKGKKKGQRSNTGKKRGPNRKWNYELETVDDISDSYMLDPVIKNQDTISIRLNSRNELVKEFNTTANSDLREALRGMFCSNACGIMEAQRGEEWEVDVVDRFRRTVTANNNVFVKHNKNA